MNQMSNLYYLMLKKLWMLLPGSLISFSYYFLFSIHCAKLYLSLYGTIYFWIMLTLLGLHLQMTSMRSVSPWGLHVQSLSVHNSPSSCDIDGDINKKHNTRYVQIFVLESFTQCLKWHVSIMFNENHFILNYKVRFSLT